MTLYTWRWLRHVALVTDATGMAALVLLPSSLPGDTELHGDLRPSNALTDRRVDEHRELRVGVVSLETHDPDALKQLGFGQLGHASGRTRLRHSCALGELNLPRPPRSFRSRLAHPISMRLGADTPVLRWTVPANALM